jgi:hypothetical protein
MDSAVGLEMKGPGILADVRLQYNLVMGNNAGECALMAT